MPGGGEEGGEGVMKGRADTAKSALKAERGGKGRKGGGHSDKEKNGMHSSTHRIE